MGTLIGAASTTNMTLANAHRERYVDTDGVKWRVIFFSSFIGLYHTARYDYWV